MQTGYSPAMPLGELAEALSAGRLSPSAVIEDIRHGLREQQALNSFIHAESNLDRLACPTPLPGLPLAGVPFSVKDNLFVRGMTATAGTPGLDDFVPDTDAGIVARLKALGATVVGKNNMHELSFGISSANPTYGTVGNPSHPAHTSGGSSGGCASAVAAGIVPFTIGTDTGGSVRIPASFCGVVGFRPTTGAWPCDGIIPVSATKDTPGLLARSAEDCHRLHALITNQRHRPYAAGKVIRLGLPKTLWSGLDAHVERTCRAALRSLASAGYECVEHDDEELLALSDSASFSVPFYEFFADFPRVLMASPGAPSAAHVLDNVRDRQVKEILDGLLHGDRHVRPADYVRALGNIRQLTARIEHLFQSRGFDALAYPTVPCEVPLLEAIGAREQFPRVIRNTDLASNAAMPSLSLPLATGTDIPVGLSLDTRPGDDLRLLELAVHTERILRNA